MPLNVAWILKTALMVRDFEPSLLCETVLDTVPSKCVPVLEMEDEE